MKYKLLGKTGIKVSELCLGAMTFGTDWNIGANKQESKAIFDYYLKKGGNFIDVANVYNKGTSEKFVGEFMQTERENLVVATKYTLTESGKVNKAGNSIKNMNQSIEKSLERLNTEYIDLLYVHAWDFTVAPEELMRNLEYLVSSGIVLSVGISDAPAWIVSKCNTIAEFRGWNPFAAYQVEYSLTEHTSDFDILPTAEHFDMTLCGFSPLAAGLLSAKYLHKPEGPRRMKEGKSLRLTDKNLEISKQLVELGNQWGHTPAQLSLRWCMQKFKKSSPIFGCRTLEQCKENLGVLDFELTADQMQILSNLNSLPEVFPHNFLDTPRVKQIVYGDNYENIEF